jgi:large repetitive protein
LTIPAGASSASFKFKDPVAESVTVQAQATGFTTLTQVETVVPGVTSQFNLTAPSAATKGTAFNVTVTAQDKYGNTTPAYTGTIHFTSSDSAALLPANYTFVSTDNGVHSFSVTLNTVGTQTVTATDTPNSQFTGVSGPITVS